MRGAADAPSALPFAVVCMAGQPPGDRGSWRRPRRATPPAPPGDPSGPYRTARRAGECGPSPLRVTRVTAWPPDLPHGRARGLRSIRHATHDALARRRHPPRGGARLPRRAVALARAAAVGARPGRRSRPGAARGDTRAVLVAAVADRGAPAARRRTGAGRAPARG